MTKINQFIKFEPILKEKIWGGNKLINILHKKTNKKNIGESWEISGVKNNDSIVSNGSLQGESLSQLINVYKEEFLGNNVYEKFGLEFPLLIKFIDAKEALSIQVHPDDERAKYRHNSFGKTEMWYVMESDEEANLIVGFKKDSNKEEYLHHLDEKSLLEILNVDSVKKGDVYFIPAGRVHAIGAGVLLAEIQQTSDITYRIYDWDRKSNDGYYRDLHTEEAVEVIDFSAQKNYKTTYKVKDTESVSVISCPYFTTNVLSISKKTSINNITKDSFVIYMCVSGELTFLLGDTIEKLIMGETLLVPACIKEFEITSKDTSKLLEVFIT